MLTQKLQQQQPEDDKPECERMVIIQLIVFIVFYVSLILIIIIMYCKYLRECKEMEKNEGSEVNYRIIKRLMEQYDQHEGVTGERTSESAGDSSRHTQHRTSSRHNRDSLPDN